MVVAPLLDMVLFLGFMAAILHCFLTFKQHIDTICIVLNKNTMQVLKKTTHNPKIHCDSRLKPR